MITTSQMILHGDIEGHKWVAIDSETNFCGVGDTECEALSDLVKALSNHVAQLRQWRTYPSTIPFAPEYPVLRRPYPIHPGFPTWIPPVSPTCQTEGEIEGR